MTDRTIVVELSTIEAAHLTELLDQFRALLTDAGGGTLDDPAIARLVPDAYRDDAEAAREFRRLTQADLLNRRAADAGTMTASLLSDGEPLRVAEMTDAEASDPVTVTLTEATAGAWLRTLSALRLVIAERLGIHGDDDHDPGDARFGVYDWLGYRLDLLVQAWDS